MLSNIERDFEKRIDDFIDSMLCRNCKIYLATDFGKETYCPECRDEINKLRGGSNGYEHATSYQ